MARFEWYDYATFSIMVIVSVAIGIYFGFGKKQNNKEEYLLGGKSMSVIPVTVSLITSTVSGITLMAYPADVYKYGSNLLFLCIMLPINGFIYSYIFLPVYLKAEVTSLYEYLEKRFSSSCRTLASLLFIILMFLHGSVVIYVPSLAFKQATGIDVAVVAPVICILCIFYTTIGGIKAVIWTDTFQFFSTISSTITIIIVGIISVGGIKNVWDTSLAGERLDIFNFRFDVTSRDTVWSIVIGATVHWSGYIICNQGEFQKCRSVPTLAKARLCTILYGFGTAIFIFTTIVNGNVMYTKYSTCDPLSTNQVYRDDQLLPYFVLDISNRIPGLPGIFIAGIFSAALSTFSAQMNTVAGVIYEDFLLKFLSQETQKKREGIILKTLVVCFGTICTLLVLVVQLVSEIVPFVSSFQGFINGILLGLMVLAVMIPVANSKGAFSGAVVSLIFVTWWGSGRLWYSFNGVSFDLEKPISEESCDFSYNKTTVKDVEDIFIMYRISFWYITVIGGGTTILIGTIVSLLTRKSDDVVDKNLISPILHRFLD
ncbi:hypothetical protein RI129_008361 [Pyrocoelia pectoralis]|uniref:Sodium-coupled monocarboxylate transporter 1 n=1 Tax=Pyrocoelia pectoralis TaxID=417401 RepID=A0AAN7VE02_9COLE